MNEKAVSSISQNIQTTQYIAIFVSLALFLYILYLVRKRRIKEEYSLLWLFSSIVFIFFSIFRNLLEEFAHLVGIAYAPAALFLLLLLAIFLILIEFSVIISKLSERNKNLAQEVGIIKQEIEKLKEKSQGSTH